MNAMNTSVRAPLDNDLNNDLDNDLADDLAEELHRAVGLIEDWLLHASAETLDELADFVYGPTHHGHEHLRWITELLGEAGARFRPAPLPAPCPPRRPDDHRPATAEPTTTEEARGTGHGAGAQGAGAGAGAGEGRPTTPKPRPPAGAQREPSR